MVSYSRLDLVCFAFYWPSRVMLVTERDIKCFPAVLVPDRFFSSRLSLVFRYQYSTICCYRLIVPSLIPINHRLNLD